jgi:hypothetical protein
MLLITDRGTEHEGATAVIGDVDDRGGETVRLIEEAGGTALFAVLLSERPRHELQQLGCG